MVRQVQMGVSTPNPTISWYRYSRPILAVIAVMAVILIVLFNQQISKLLELWGIKAALNTGSASLQGANNVAPDYFLADGFSASEYDPATGNWVDNNNAVTVDEATNRLMVN
ncbi:MAG: hypothetical protein VE96_C0015G0003 [candidate division Kazan bacterium GW2011_GWA1_44_22]|uniref:Uncharacterized protein n=1 Tax=candidate division Kazan bacterium GW2011_GWA1_44_22 TaxID=1620410 RepID=A0A0G1I022_UNCK3|nr:MAG: hypothetical protein VE96_C0015G0003 [candidate division Kazan bacterium GW2011_GWA1_44_22]